MNDKIGHGPRLLALSRLAEQAAFPAAATATILLVWEILTRVLTPPQDLLPGPTRILIEMWLESDRLRMHALFTTVEIVSGLLIALLVAVPFSMAVETRSPVKQLLAPLISFSSQIPLVLLTPLVFIWLGYGVQTKVTVCALLAWIAIVRSIHTGMEAFPGEITDFLRTTGAKSWQLLASILFPANLPHLFAGVKRGFMAALLGSVTAEFIEAENGLGFLIVTATSRLDMPMLCAAFASLILIAAVIQLAIEVLERITVPWHFAQRVD